MSDLLRGNEAIYLRVAAGEKLIDLIMKLATVIVLSGGAYGFTMGLYHSPMQAVSAAIKFPLMLFVTLAVTLPALHGFHLFWGGTMRVTQTIAVAMVGTATMSLLVCTLAPVSLFFLASGSGYDFLLLMHVVACSATGACGLVAVNRCRTVVGEKGPARQESAVWLFNAWKVLYMFVGTQVAYLLGPFVCKEGPFMWISKAPENFYIHVMRSVGAMLSGGSH